MEWKNKEDWPSFGYLPYVGKYFRIHHGSSNKQFSDIPSGAIISLIMRLNTIEDSATGFLDFREKALYEINNWNEILPTELQIPKGMIKVSLDKFNWGENKKTHKFGLKVKVDWDIFFEYVEKQSKIEKNLWETFSYIYICKNVFTLKSLKEKKNKFEESMERYTESVKMKSMVYMEETFSSLAIIEKNTEKTISDLYNCINKRSRKLKKDPAYTPYTLIYLNELRLKCHTLEALINVGDFPACLSEMRRIIEGFTIHLFWDQLKINVLKLDSRAKYSELMDVFTEGSYKEARDNNLNIREISKKKDLGENDVLKTILKEYQPDSNEIKIFIKNLHKTMSLATYIIIYGKILSNSTLSKYDDKKIRNSKLSIVDLKENIDILEIAIKEIINALPKRENADTQTLKNIHDIIYNKLNVEKIIIAPPSPTMPLRFLDESVLPHDTYRLLNDMYNEFSPFVHATWESNTVWPFTSVLEIMVFSEILLRFSKAMVFAINDSSGFISSMIDVLLI